MENTIRPFAMVNLDLTTNQTRGYKPQPNTWDYDPFTQTTNQLTMGDTSPTTYSSVGSTGILTTDTDEGSDDEGKD